MKRRSAQSRKVIDLAVLKCLTGAKLDLHELSEMTTVLTSELLTVFGCDSIMSERILTHVKSESQRQKAQNLFADREEKKK